MERLLGRCDNNILIFRQAIEKEEKTKAEYAEIIRVLRKKVEAEALAIAVPAQRK
jgi:hypothetical protein